MRGLLLLVLVLPPTLGTGCGDSGTFDPDVDAGVVLRDAGPIDRIGEACTYEADAGAPNPNDQCPPGLECFIVTRDGLYDQGLTLAAWEDHLTVYGQKIDSGACTIVKSTADRVVCPPGTALKVFSTDVVACLKTCEQPSDCGRADYTCDSRYYDTEPENVSTCVRRCEFDVPDCVRSGVLAVEGRLVPTLAFEDLSGASQCNTGTGQCELVAARGAAGPGEPCLKTEDCEAGSVCMQAPILAAVLGPAAGVDTSGPGFCASPCSPVANPQSLEEAQSNCTASYVCQSVGALNLGFRDPQQGVPGPIVFDRATQSIETRGGFCFHQCTDGVDASCDAIPGTTCGSLNESAVVDAWNAVPMCLPPAVAN